MTLKRRIGKLEQRPGARELPQLVMHTRAGFALVGTGRTLTQSEFDVWLAGRTGLVKLVDLSEAALPPL